MIAKLLATISYVAVVIQPSLTDSSCDSFVLKMNRDVHPGYSLRSHVIETLTVHSPLACYSKCVDLCLCLSFNVCENGKRCELNSETKDEHPTDYEQNDQCTYYGFSQNEGSSSNKNAGETCRGCCLTSQPCLNGGKCQQVCEIGGQRFRCACPDGFKGRRCEVKPRSCADYAQSSNRTHGIRVIYTPENSTLEVFCHFRTSSTMTLAMSYSRARNVEIRRYSVYKDFPLNENSFSWDYYRLSLAHMQGLRDVSTQWAFTCAYPTRGFSTTDYVLSSINETDVTTYNSEKSDRCRRYQYLNINGNVCENCQILTNQGAWIFNIGADALSRCEGFQLSEGVIRCDSGTAVYYFGFYGCYTSAKFTCVASSSATTQLWFIG